MSLIRASGERDSGAINPWRFLIYYEKPTIRDWIKQAGWIEDSPQQATGNLHSKESKIII